MIKDMGDDRSKSFMEILRRIIESKNSKEKAIEFLKKFKQKHGSNKEQA